MSITLLYALVRSSTLINNESIVKNLEVLDFESETAGGK